MFELMGIEVEALAVGSDNGVAIELDGKSGMVTYRLVRGFPDTAYTASIWVSR